MKYKALIFDFDFTLIDSSVGIWHCINHGLKNLGHPEVEYEVAKATIGHHLEETYQILTESNDEKLQAQFSDYFIEMANAKPSVLTKHTELFPDFHLLFETIAKHDVKTGIVTSKHRIALDDALDKFDLHEHFHFTLAGDEMEKYKPEPDGLLQAINRLDVTNEQTLYVGDSHIDAETASRANVDFVGILTGTTAPEEFDAHPSVDLFDNLAGLQKYVLELSS